MVVNLDNVQWTHNADTCLLWFNAIPDDLDWWKQCLLQIDLKDIMPEISGYSLFLRQRKTYSYVANTLLKEFDVNTTYFYNSI